MSFSQKIKDQVQKKSDFKCIVCHGVFPDVHHIIPEAEGGPDTEDNAAALCPSCHRKYGGNPELRRKIRQMRDNHYERVEILYRTNGSTLIEINNRLSTLASDMNSMFDEMKGLLIEKYPEKKQEIESANIFSGITGLTAGSQSAESLNKGLQVHGFFACPHCGTVGGGLNGNTCHHCGEKL